MPAAIGLLLALLAILGTLQYQWLGQVSEAERGRLRASARRHADDFAADFDRQLARAWAYLRVDIEMLDGEAGGEAYAARFDAWQRSADHTDIVKSVFVVDRHDDERPGLRRFDADSRRFVPEEWPAAWSGLRERAQRLFHPEAGGNNYWRDASGGDAEVPALLVPIPVLRLPPRAEERESRPSSGRGPELAASSAARRRAGSADGWQRGAPRFWPSGAFMLMVLDRGVLETQLLPELVTRHFGEHEPREFEVAVVGSASQRPIVRSAEIEAPSADATSPLLGLRFEDAFDELARLPGGTVFQGDLRRGEATRAGPRPRGPAREPSGAWRAVVRHRDGPIGAVVARARTRNLAVSFGILGVLGASAALLVVSAQRSRRLARQQIDFVAGVSHELRTPVASISASAQNLADGVVRDAEQVKRYGAVIHAEARRLSAMVGQVLEFAAPDTLGPRTPVDFRGLAGDALAATAPDFAPTGLEVGLLVEPNLPAVEGDAGALRRAIENLLSNAAKYAGASGTVEVRIAAAANRVLVSVSDSGPGIPEAEQPHVFEPFFRGQQARDGQIRGSGLGLNLVQRIAEAHGGRVVLESVTGKGSRFTIELPAASAKQARSSAEVTSAEAHPSR